MCQYHREMGKIMHTIELIENYILYLKTDCKLSVTLHPMKRESLISFSRLMQFNIHDNSYCSYVKFTLGGPDRCRAQQREFAADCPMDGVCCTCYAGVFQYIYPIYGKNETYGFIAVSGYTAPESEADLTRYAEQLGSDTESLKKVYRTLKAGRPDKKTIDTLILPLCQMLELAYLKEETTPGEESLITRILRYTRQHYEMNLNTKTICDKYHCSRSHFSHSFKKETGKSFREYLTELRLEQAKHLLRFSSIRVGEIAFSVGFNDPNYFSNVFRAYEGLSPREYRTRNKP